MGAFQMQSEPLVASESTRVGEVSPPVFSAVPATAVSLLEQGIAFTSALKPNRLALSPIFSHLVVCELREADIKQYLPHCFYKD